MKRWFDIRRDEWATLVWAFATLSLVLGSHAILETARDALFLASIPAARLPWVYLGVAALGLLLARFHWRVNGTAIAATLVVGAAVTAGFWLAVSPDAKWSLYALYLWSALFASVATVQLWIFVDTRFTSTEAKRLFGFIGTGGITGAIAGSALARGLTELAATRHLLIAAAVLMIAAAVVSVGLSRALARRPSDGGTRPSQRVGEALAYIRGNPYVRRVGALILVSTIALTLADYLFKSIVAAHFDDARSLGEFFASFYTGVNAASLLVQVGLVSAILRKLGLVPALAALPLMMAGPAAWIGLGGGVIAAVALKGVDGSLRHSLHRTAVEVLYLPLSSRVRAAAKLLIDIAGHRGGQALGSLLILALLAIAPSPRPLLAVIAVALLFSWVAIAIAVYRANRRLFRETLRAESVSTRIAFPELDMASLEGLIARLNSLDDREVCAALEILEHTRRGYLVPDLVLFHPSTSVVLSALELFIREGRTSFVPVAERLLRESEVPEIRAAALLALDDVEGDDARLRRLAGDGDPWLATAAVLRMMSRDSGPDLRARLAQLRGAADTELPLARAARRSPSPESRALLRELAASDDRRVLGEVIAAAHEPGRDDLAAELLPMLAIRALRPRARAALVAIGPPALELLERELDDPDLDPEILLHLPRTISRFPAASALPILMRCLREQRDEVVRYKALRGLGRLLAESPELDLDDGAIAELLAAEIERAAELVVARAQVSDLRPRSHRFDLLRSVLADRYGQSLEIAFRLVGLRHPRRPLEDIYKGIGSRDRRVQNSARELLRDILDRDEEALLVLIDDSSDRDKLGYLEDLVYTGATAGDVLDGLAAGDDELCAEVARRCLEELAP